MNMKHRSVLLGLLLTGIAVLPGCQSVTLAFGTDAASAKTQASELFSAFEQRFTNVTRSPKFETARSRIGRYALAPSKLVNDSSIWTSSRDGQYGPIRNLELSGGLSASQYTLAARPQVATPSRIGEQKHLIQLIALGNDNWQWKTEVEHAIGTMPPSRVSDIANALFRSAERSPTEIRSDYSSAFPRTSRALGRMFSIESVDAVGQPDGSTLVQLKVTATSDGLKTDFPDFAKYVDKYIEPARYRFRLTDRFGAEWFDANSEKGRMTVRFRSRNGELQPISGTARKRPDSLTINVDALAKISFFTVGVTEMKGDFVIVKTSGERAWDLRFRKNPKWHLPLIGERLLKSPLERPFEGDGISFRMSVRQSDEKSAVRTTLFTRTLSARVEESAIMRFIGNLGFTAMSDYAGKVEAQENRFIQQAFAALRADVNAGLGSAGF